jgi:protein SCO1/2
MRGRLLTIIIAGFLIGALGGAAALVLTRPAPTAGTVISTGKADIGGPFSLIDQHGKTVTDQDFRGRYMLVFFGFTRCPDICPTELQVMSAALDGLGPKAEKVVPIFITLDPGHDTPEAVGAYVKNFGENFVGLTGSPEAIDKAAKAYRVAYQQFEYKGKDENYGYSIDHSAFVYFMGPDGELKELFNYGTPAEKITATLERYL